MLNTTRHAEQRINERNIPTELIQRAIDEGHRVLLPDRNAIEYTLKNVLGCRGVNLIVITSLEGAVVTAYAEKGPSKGWHHR